MAASGKDTQLDWESIGTYIRDTRRLQRLSQSELAMRAGVDLASVYRVERGLAVRITTLRKIADGLQVLAETFLSKNPGASETQVLPVHRATDARWFAVADRRQRPPADKEDQSQDENERLRLGRLGFVPCFMCPPLIIPPNGPGVVLLEVYSEIDGPFNAEFYRDGALYVLKGGATVTIGELSSELQQGDWVAFSTGELKKVSVLEPHPVAQLMWIGATRKKRQRAKKADDTDP